MCNMQKYDVTVLLMTHLWTNYISFDKKVMLNILFKKHLKATAISGHVLTSRFVNTSFNGKVKNIMKH